MTTELVLLLMFLTLYLPFMACFITRCVVRTFYQTQKDFQPFHSTGVSSHGHDQTET